MVHQLGSLGRQDTEDLDKSAGRRCRVLGKPHQTSWLHCFNRLWYQLQFASRASRSRARARGSTGAIYAYGNDVNGDGVVGITDFLALLAEWGLCADCNDCPADFDGDCSVGITDMLILLANWTT